MTTANKITLTRILLIPVFVMVAVYYGQSVVAGTPHEWQRWLAIGLFILIAATDALDGWVARRFNQKSRLGMLLDPIADKGLLISAMVVMTFGNWRYELPVWFTVTVFARDAIVVAGVVALRLLMPERTFAVRPSWSGKAATAAQMTALILAMLQWNFFHLPVNVAGLHWTFDFLDLPALIAVGFTVVSGLGYVRTGMAQLHEKGHGEGKPWSEL
jgi:CDP-diacylglycerol--glycerol-3-phosphate 3-phosphatidyltransferase